MKKIKLVNYNRPNLKSVRIKDKLYSVSLGNGYTSTFPNEKETLAFLAQTNRDLSTKMYELNFLFSEVLRTYRNAWPYFEPGKRSIENNLQGIIKDRVSAIENSFNYMVDRAGMENGNHLTFTHFYSIIDSIKEVCSDIIQLFYTRNLTNSMYEAQSFLTRLDHLYTAIVIYPQKIELVKENRQVKAVLKVV